ncbi:two-component system, NarL family, invasion response regulator UvrY [Evansella caseinilytica]|uniref:Two-component system, NarL family, invasion response regulator UvrY n=1 Tax=Evansella caseinilytica TaxID=1503961 RepID=A0A1H3QB99_9BACI|nr:response regulator transcription factor [Evansella caseinilytica]SDZ10637.1 two-component system, NarL family, invasion response regulator UvrY [Evansella caseinilytica]
MRVLIGMEHELLRYGLIQLLKDLQPVEYMATASTVEAFIDVVRKFHFDLIIIDIRLSGAGGLTSVFSELEQLPPVQKRVLMCHDDSRLEETESAVERDIIDGTCHSESTLEELMAFFQRILKGERVYLYIAMNGKYRIPGGDNGQELSKREQEVFHMKVRGYTVKETAELLNISPKTVENHRRNIRKKLNIRRNSEWYEWGEKLSML